MIEESTGVSISLVLSYWPFDLPSYKASPEVQDDSIKSPLKKDNKINCYASESVYSPSPSACSVPQCHADNGSVSASAAKDDYTELVNQLDSESSTTQVEILYNFLDLKEDLAMAKTSALTTSQI